VIGLAPVRIDLDTRWRTNAADQSLAPSHVRGTPRARSEEISWRLELSLLRIYLKQRTERSRGRRTSLPINDLPKPERAA
jgi:hypothetical protein